MPTNITLTTAPDGTEHLTISTSDETITDAITEWCAQVGLDARQHLQRDPIIVSPDRRTITVQQIETTVEGRMDLSDDLVPRRSQRVLTLDRPAPPWPQIILDAASEETRR